MQRLGLKGILWLWVRGERGMGRSRLPVTLLSPDLIIDHVRIEGIDGVMGDRSGRYIIYALRRGESSTMIGDP